MASCFIAFFGPDGSGKSTHAELLVGYFRSQESKVRKVWIRSPHTLAFFLSRLFVRIGFWSVVSNSFARKGKSPVVSTRWFRLFWSLVELISVIPLILFRVYIPLFLGYTVIAERYVADTAVTIAYFFNDLDFLQSRTAKLLLCFIPRNTVFIHLDANYSTIMKRRGRIGEPYDFIEFQKMGYKMIRNSLGAKLIDTSNASIKRTSMQIMRCLESTKFSRHMHITSNDCLSAISS